MTPLIIFVIVALVVIAVHYPQRFSKTEPDKNIPDDETPIPHDDQTPTSPDKKIIQFVQEARSCAKEIIQKIDQEVAENQRIEKEILGRLPVLMNDAAVMLSGRFENGHVVSSRTSAVDGLTRAIQRDLDSVDSAESIASAARSVYPHIESDYAEIMRIPVGSKRLADEIDDYKIVYDAAKARLSSIASQDTTNSDLGRRVFLVVKDAIDEGKESLAWVALGHYLPVLANTTQVTEGLWRRVAPMFEGGPPDAILDEADDLEHITEGTVLRSAAGMFAARLRMLSHRVKAASNIDDKSSEAYRGYTLGLAISECRNFSGRSRIAATSTFSALPSWPYPCRLIDSASGEAAGKCSETQEGGCKTVLIEIADHTPLESGGVAPYIHDAGKLWRFERGEAFLMKETLNAGKIESSCGYIYIEDESGKKQIPNGDPSNITWVPAEL